MKTCLGSGLLVAVLLLLAACKEPLEPGASLTGTWHSSLMTLDLTQTDEGTFGGSGHLTSGTALWVWGLNANDDITLRIAPQSALDGNWEATWTGHFDGANAISGAFRGYIWTDTPLTFTRSQ